MFEVIKKSLGKFDYLILAAAVWLFSHFDYSNLETGDIFYIVTFVLWFIMLCVRIYILYKNEEDK